MIKTVLTTTFTITILLTSVIAGAIAFMPEAEAIKSKGNYLTEIRSKKVCGDRLCSEVEPPKKEEVKTEPPKKEEVKTEPPKKEEVKTEKKMTEQEKAQTVPPKDLKSQTMEEAKMLAQALARKTLTGTIVSSQDPGIGHETHQLAIILPPSDKIYRGHLTYSASESIQLVALHGPLAEGQDKGQLVWTPDGKTKYALTLVDTGLAMGMWTFSGNAIAVHTMNPVPFTVTYAVSYSERLLADDMVFSGTKTSSQDPGIGHETHQLAIIFPPRDTAYNGYMTYSASTNVQFVTLVGPLDIGQIKGQATWTPDGKTHYGMMLFDPQKSSGSWQFSGNAVAMHTMTPEPFTISYSAVLRN